MLRRGKLKYSARTYSNPFFNRRRKNNRLFSDRSLLSWKYKLIIASTLILIAAILGFLFFSPLFDLKYAVISGNDKTSSAEIEKYLWEQTEEKRFLFGKQKNLFLFNGEKIKEKLSDLYYFETIKIKKDFPHTINITVEEKKYSLIWLEGEKYYYIDKNGNLVSEADPLQISQENYPLVEDLRGDGINGLNVGIGQEAADYIIALFVKFKDSNQELKIDRFKIDNDINTVKISIINGPQIYFDVTKDMGSQLDKLSVLMKEKLKDNLQNKQYIDLRYGDRVYYK